MRTTALAIALSLGIIPLQAASNTKIHHAKVKKNKVNHKAPKPKVHAQAN